jgi:hypothetical protein
LEGACTAPTHGPKWTEGSPRNFYMSGAPKKTKEAKLKNDPRRRHPPQSPALMPASGNKASVLPARGSPAARSPPPMSTARLRMVFDKFDTDKSGAVSMDEMKQMIKTLKLPFSDEQLAQLMKEADPDGSGQIEFEEFVAVLQKQIKDGKGDLAGVVTEASATFGWLNPLSWFGGDESTVPDAPVQPPTPPPAPVKTPPKSPKTKASRSPKGSSRRNRRSGSPNSPTHRMKKTQASVQSANHENALMMREEKDAAKSWFYQQKDDFLAEQHEKVLRGHQQAVERQQAIEALKLVKRSMGSEMRSELDKKLAQEREVKKEFVAASHNTVFDARKKKQSAVRARQMADREQAIAIGEAAKIARAERKEIAKATVRREEQAARDFTSQVRYETRPDVRKVGADMFQAQRDLAAEEARQKAQRDAEAMKQAHSAYLARAEQVRERVEALHSSTRASREALAEARRHGAHGLRQKLHEESMRKQEVEEMTRQEKQAIHDSIFGWSKTSVVAPNER